MAFFAEAETGNVCGALNVSLFRFLDPEDTQTCICHTIIMEKLMRSVTTKMDGCFSFFFLIG